MNEPLFQALTDWEAGDLSIEELVARHPEVAGILAVHERLSALAAEPGPDPERSLAAVRERIADRPAISRPKRASKVFVAALVAAALSGSAAIAAPGAVRSVVDGVRSGIERIFGSGDSGDPGQAGTPSAPVTTSPDRGRSESPGEDDEGNVPAGSGNGQSDSEQQEGPTQGGEDEGSQGNDGEDEQRGGGDDQQAGGDEQQGGGDEQQGGGDDQQGDGDAGGSGDSGQDRSTSDGSGGSADQAGNGD
jgi:hypothetical protein